MRRIVMALLATVIGAGLLVGLKSRPLASLAGAVAEAPLEQGLTGPDPAEPAPNGPAPTGAASTPDGATPTVSGSAVPASRPPTAPAPASRTLTGNAVAASSFGSMQVRIVVTGSHIDSISTIRQSNRARNTATVLTPLALTAQAVPSAACRTTVSGATYSCEAWKQSLQSAIGQI